MNKRKLLILDILYSKNGSFDDDFNFISQTLDNDYEIKYFKGNPKKRLLTYFQVLFILIGNRYHRYLFLSFNTPFLLICRRFFKRRFYKYRFILHFIPSDKEIFHGKIIRNSIYYGIRIGFYSPALAEQFKSKNFLLARKTNSFEENFSNHKLKEDSIFIPKYNHAREKIDIKYLFQKLSVHHNIKKVYSQNEIDENELPVGIDFQLYDYLDVKTYNEILTRSKFIVIVFNPKYELRISGFLLDALNYGCSVITNDHPITRQFGFPNAFVRDLKLLSREDIAMTKMKYEFDKSSSKKRWLDFIKNGDISL